jgi:hypothetical protein
VSPIAVIMLSTPPIYLHVYFLLRANGICMWLCVWVCVCVCKIILKIWCRCNTICLISCDILHHAIIITVSALYRRMRRHSTWLQRARFRFRMPFGRAVSATVKSVSCDCSSYGSHLCSCKSSDDCTDYIAALPWFYRCCIALWLCLNRIALSQIMLLQV